MHGCGEPGDMARAGSPGADGRELPVAKVISVEPQFVGDKTPIDVPVVPLTALWESGMLDTAAAVLAQRLLQRATG
jgi:hypothetical protein